MHRFSGYIIERFEKKGGGDWAPVNMHPVLDCQATVPNLAEGETYQFRIKAVNSAGEGAPSRPCEPVTCKPYIGMLSYSFSTLNQLSRCFSTTWSTRAA